MGIIPIPLVVVQCGVFHLLIIAAFFGSNINIVIIRVINRFPNKIGVAIFSGIRDVSGSGWLVYIVLHPADGQVHGTVYRKNFFNGNGEILVFAVRRTHADNLSCCVEQSAAAAAMSNGRSHGNDVVCISIDSAGAGNITFAFGRTNGCDFFPCCDGIGGSHRMQSLFVNLQQSNICLRIKANDGDAARVDGAVIEYDLSGGSVFDDMEVGGNETIF